MNLLRSDILSGVIHVESEAPFYIADRGGCTFVMKALNAQNAGAKLLIVVDDQEENENFVLPVDDGHGTLINSASSAKSSLGGALRIPLILVNKKTGELLKKYIHEDETFPVSISVKFAMVSQLNRDLCPY